MRFMLMLAVVLSFSANAAETRPAPAKEVRVYEVNRYGQTQYHKGYLKVSGDKVVPVNKYGQTLHHKTSKIKTN